MVNFDVVMLWMQYIRNNPDNAYRFSENFYQSQIDSKKWLINHIPSDVSTICIFGGWYGLLAQYISFKFPNVYILNTDIDPSCEEVFQQINISENIYHKTWDMSDGIPSSLCPDLVINTVAEHVTQDVYDTWWDSVPTGTKYIVQGNNLAHPEHIRLADNLVEFLNMNNIKDPEHAGMLKCGHFYRFMATGIK